MNEQTAPTTPAKPIEDTPLKKKRIKRGPIAPRKPRVVDPAIAAINAEAAAKRKAHKQALASGKVYNRIVKWCERLTNLDKQKLVDSFAEIGRE